MANDSTIDLLTHQIYPNLNIREVLADLNPKDSGSYFTVTCPFCKKREAYIYKHKQYIQCNRRNKCGRHISLWDYVKEKKQLDNKSTLEELARMANITLPKLTPKDIGLEKEKEDMAALYHKLNQYYQYMLRDRPEGQSALEYLTKKRTVARAMIQRFELGYALPAWTHQYEFLKSRHFSEELIIQSGIAKYSRKGRLHDVFRKRVIFPITDLHGRLIGFGGRALGDDTQPKYLNSPESVLFKKRDTLYNLHGAIDPIRRSETVVLMEGYMDVIMACQRGVKNAVATLGTAFGISHANILHRYAKNIFVAYDGDAAGRKAALRVLEILADAACDGRVVSFDEGEDPGDYFAKHGKDDFEARLTDAKDYVDLVISDARLNDPAQRSGALQRIFTYVNKFKSSIEIEMKLNKTAVLLSVDPNAVRNDFKSYQQNAPKNITSPVEIRQETIHEPPPLEEGPRSSGASTSQIRREQHLMAFFYKYPDLMISRMGYIFPSDFAQPSYGALFSRMQKINLQYIKEANKQKQALIEFIQKELPEVVTLSEKLDDPGIPKESATEEQKAENLRLCNHFITQVTAQLRIDALKQEEMIIKSAVLGNPEATPEELRELNEEIMLKTLERTRMQAMRAANHQKPDAKRITVT